MQTRRISIGVISALFAASLSAGARADLGGPTNPAAPLAQNGSAFTYQGQLRKSGAPVNASCNASFSLYDAATGGASVGGVVTSPTLQVTNGLFSIPLDFGWNFNGEARWLETAIGCGDAPTILTPRTALRPAPYAFALPGMRTVPGDNDGGGNPTMNVVGGVSNGVTGNSISTDSVNSVVAGGEFNRVDVNSTRGAIAGGSGNAIGGGSGFGAIAGGSSNSLRNNSQYGAIGGGYLNNISGTAYSVINGGWYNAINGNSTSGAIGGGFGNGIDNNSGYSAIAGGSSNAIGGSSSSGAIGGGAYNRIHDSNYGAIAGGGENLISGTSALGMIAGGQHNRIENASALSVIGGGFYNAIENTSDRGVIGGGASNYVGNNSGYSVVGGGFGNVITTAVFAAIPGGIQNRVEGDYGFAAGRQAKALHDGAFVWGDSTNADIASTAANQFIVRASGGAQLSGVASPAATQLTVAGVISTTGGVKFPDGKTQTSAAATPSNIVIVAKSGGHFSTISAALTSITDNSATNRYLVYVAPGTYTETVTMKPFVDIEGAGELVTILTQVGSASDTGTVVGASNAELRYLSVNNSGGNTFATAIYSNGTSPRFSHVMASATGGVETNGIKNNTASPILADVTISVTGGGLGLNNSYSSLALTNVSVSVTGGGAAGGMNNYESSVTINNSAIGGSGAGFNYGIANQGGSGAFTVRIRNSQISGSNFTISNNALYTTSVGVSQLSGGAVTGGGILTCVGVFDENYASAGYTTCP